MSKIGCVYYQVFVDDAANGSDVVEFEDYKSAEKYAIEWAKGVKDHKVIISKVSENWITEIEGMKK